MSVSPLSSHLPACAFALLLSGAPFTYAADAASAGSPAQAHGSHNTMNHGQMDHSQMSHEHMGHGSMNHGSMEHGGAEHSSHTATQSAPAAQSRTPIPPVTDAMREAAFPPLAGHAVHDSAIHSYLLFDQLEWQDAKGGATLNWQVEGWIGGDVDRFNFRSEGQRTNGHTEEAEIQALWGHAITPWWETVVGVRQDFKPGSPQTWAAFGIQGEAIKDLDLEVTAFLGEGNQTGLRLEAKYDMMLTNNLILQPHTELNFYGKNDEARGTGSGLSETEFGLRLRYEITLQFAPYVGVSWNNTHGQTASYAREEGEDTHDARLVAGIRMWF
ncbi:copper resistance protein B [Pseudomonas asuensis]|uniref:copper resistance protein B n=1 Tax=Pseudomonas asuensis TaxID=1825787 RepID=UPI001667A485